MAKTILGISAYYHDAAACLVRDGVIVAAAQEERFTRIKHDPAFPKHAVKYCLQEAGIGIRDLDAIVFYDKPFLKLERLLETYMYFAPHGLKSFLSAIPVWIKEKMMFRRLLNKSLAEFEGFDKKRQVILFSQHHLSHAASAFYPSRFEEAAILTIDGVGEWATASIARGRGKDIELLKEMHFPHSVGLLYSAFTYYLGFVVNSGEYKLMGLAPYGNHGSSRVEQFKEAIKKHLLAVHDDGSVRLNQEYFSYATGLTMVPKDSWEKLFGFGRRESQEKLEQHHCDLALAIQQVTEEIVLKMARHAKELTGANYLCLAGGVALNCVANGKLLREKVFDDLWIQPAAGDAGGALGAALAAHHLFFGEARVPVAVGDAMRGSYLGPAFDEYDALALGKRFGAVFQRLGGQEELSSRVASLLVGGKIVGWFQGRMEWGPRALGNRSILADARNPEMQKRLNLSIKYREGFRPFAPAVMAEEAASFFDIDRPSPYMLLVADVVAARRKPLPDDYATRDWKGKLYVERSDIPAVTHLDYSARLQTVHRETNERFWTLLEHVKRLTGYGLVINTSFNVRGEPIVCTPEDAYRCFMRTEMDYLVVGDLVFNKSEQPAWNETDTWRTQYGKD